MGKIILEIASTINKTMNILFASIGHISKQRGGIDRVTDIISKELIRLGNNVYMISLWKALEEDPSYPYQYFLPSQELSNKDNENFINTFIEEHNIDIIVNQSDSIGMVRLLKNASFKTPIISFLHNDPLAIYKSLQDNWDLWKIKDGNIVFYLKYPYYFARLLYQRYTRGKFVKEKLKYLYKNSDAVVLLSERFKKSYVRVAGLKEQKKLFSIHNPFSFDISERNIPCNKKKSILFVGRLEFHQKRPDRILKVWQMLGKKTDGWQLTLVGDGSYRNQLESFCQKHNLSNVCFTGNIDPQEYYKEAEILCMTSTYEGLPMVLIEALQYSVIPIVHDSCESVKDLIENNKDSKIIEPFSIEEYAKALHVLMTDDELRTKFRKNIADKHFDKSLSAKNIVVKWNDLFNIVTRK